MKYKVYYNKHRFQDCSDIPKLATRIIQASSGEGSEDILAGIREYSSDSGIQTKLGNKYYIGLIHFGSSEKIE